VIEMMSSLHRAAELDVARFERVNNVTLPKGYRRFLSDQNGGRPRDGEFPVPGWGVTVIDTFFGIGTGDSYDLQRQFDRLADSRNSDLLPIATDPGGLLLFLAIRGAHVGRIFFWDHKDSASQPVQVAADFETFAASLKPDGAYDAYEFGLAPKHSG
jgi:SMI1/KNR4 family protein SUKH-1